MMSDALSGWWGVGGGGGEVHVCLVPSALSGWPIWWVVHVCLVLCQDGGGGGGGGGGGEVHVCLVFCQDGGWYMSA